MKKNSIYIALIGVITVFIVGILFFIINADTTTSPLTLISPNGGEIYCRGEDIPIEWRLGEAAGIDIVSIVLQTSPSSFASIDDYPAVKERVLWDGSIRASSGVVQAKDIYKIQIIGRSNNGGLEKDISDSIFSIKDCS